MPNNQTSFDKRTKLFEALTLSVSTNQMEALKSTFEYSPHPLNPKEIIIEVVDDENALLDFANAIDEPVDSAVPSLYVVYVNDR